MTEKEKKYTFQKTEVTEIVSFFDRIEKEQLTGLSYPKKAHKATLWLKRDKPFTEGTVRRWYKNEEQIRRQAAAVVVRKKHDPRGKVSVKTLRSEAEFEFQPKPKKRKITDFFVKKKK